MTRRDLADALGLGPDEPDFDVYDPRPVTCRVCHRPLDDTELLHNGDVCDDHAEGVIEVALTFGDEVDAARSAEAFRREHMPFAVHDMTLDPTPPCRCQICKGPQK